MTITIILATSFFFVYLIVNAIRKEAAKQEVKATHSISKKNAVFTASASARIRGTVDEVFNFVIQYKDCGESVAFSGYKWQDVDDENVPLSGSAGTYKMDIDPYGPRMVAVKLDFLDREKKIVSEVSTTYLPWLLRVARVQEVVPVPNNPNWCEYRTYITGQGLAAYYVLFAANEELVDSLEQCAVNLQAYFLEKSC